MAYAPRYGIAEPGPRAVDAKPVGTVVAFSAPIGTFRFTKFGNRTSKMAAWSAGTGKYLGIILRRRELGRREAPPAKKFLVKLSGVGVEATRIGGRSGYETTGGAKSGEVEIRIMVAGGLQRRFSASNSGIGPSEMPHKRFSQHGTIVGLGLGAPWEMGPTRLEAARGERASRRCRTPSSTPRADGIRRRGVQGRAVAGAAL
jgi:hypothetical protein